MIDRAIARRRHKRLDPDEARARAYLELMLALDTWRGGTNFAGYFWRRLTAMFERGYSSTPEEERELRRKVAQRQREWEARTLEYLQLSA